MIFEICGIVEELNHVAAEKTEKNEEDDSVATEETEVKSYIEGNQICATRSKNPFCRTFSPKLKSEMSSDADIIVKSFPKTGLPENLYNSVMEHLDYDAFQELGTYINKDKYSNPNPVYFCKPKVISY